MAGDDAETALVPRVEDGETHSTGLPFGFHQGVLTAASEGVGLSVEGADGAGADEGAGGSALLLAALPLTLIAGTGVASLVDGISGLVLLFVVVAGALLLGDAVVVLVEDGT